MTISVIKPLAAIFLTAISCLSFSQAWDETPGKKGDEVRDRFIASQVKKIQDKSFAGIRTQEDWLKGKEEMRRQYLEMLGLWPLPVKTPLKPQITGIVDAGDFLVEKVHFQSFPGLYVTGNLYRPKNQKGKIPAILYVCGHGNVVQQEIVDGKKIQVSYGSKVHYQYHPVWFAQNGYVCLALDTLQLGEIQGIHHGTYNRGMWWWQSLGYTPAGVECWNAMRALDYLQSREEVDGSKLGVTGRSGGGATSWWIAAADERIQCAAPVAGIADLHAHLVKGVAPRFKKGVITGHCDCMFFINLYQWDFTQLIALCSPRPVLLGNSDADPIFPVPGYRRMAEEVKKIYALQGAEGKFDLLETKGDHVDTVELRAGINAWMNRWLKGDNTKPAGEMTKKFSPKELQVFSSLPAGEINSTLHDHFVQPARWEIPGKISDKEIAAMRQKTIAALERIPFRNWAVDSSKPRLAKTGEKTAGDLRLRTFEFTSEAGISLEIFVLSSALEEKAKTLSVEVVDEAGWNGFLQKTDPFLQKWIAGESKSEEKAAGEGKNISLAPGEVRLVITPRGIGRRKWSDEFLLEGKPQSYQLKRRLALLGHTLDSLRVWDTLQGIRALKEDKAFSGTPIHLKGNGEMAGIALYAALLDGDVQSLELHDLPSSHRQGPTFLGVLRQLDIPQALGMIYPRPVKLTFSNSEDVTRFDWVWKFQKAAGKEFIQVTNRGK